MGTFIVRSGTVALSPVAMNDIKRSYPVDHAFYVCDATIITVLTSGPGSAARHNLAIIQYRTTKHDNFYSA